MVKETNVVAVNVWSRWALTDTGTCLYISELFDEYGEDTDDPEKAVAGICACSGGWLAIDFDEFGEVDYLQ